MTKKSSKINSPNILALSAFGGLISVITGALAAHGLKPVLDSALLDNVHTATRYLLFHAIFSIAVLQIEFIPESSKKLIALLSIIGSYLFSCSIYLLVYLKHIDIDITLFLALITPLGGTIMVIAWLILFIKAIKKHA